MIGKRLYQKFFQAKQILMIAPSLLGESLALQLTSQDDNLEIILDKKDINAAETSILSAKGSKYIPNFVITLYLRAIYPSNQSVIEAKIKINKAYNSYPVNKE